MDIQQIIDITSESSQQTLLQYLKEHLTSEQQKLFAESFYLTFFNKDEGFVVDGDKAMEWIGYTHKNMFVKALTKHLEKDQEWVLSQETQNLPQGGRPRNEYKLTVDAFKKLGMKANTTNGNAIREYYIEMERCLFKYAMQQSMQRSMQVEKEKQVIEEHAQKLLENNNLLNQEKSALEKEVNAFRNTQSKPCIYIYDTDARIPSETNKKSLKIGVAENLFNRVKPYRQVTPHGKSVFSIDVTALNLRTTEGWLHMLLKPYNIGGEVFEMSIEEAKLWITKQVNTLKASEILDATERYTLLSKMVDLENQLMNYEDRPRMSTTEAGTQTEEFTQIQTNATQEENHSDVFAKFIDECCDIQPDYEVSSTDIIGQFRLWNRKTEKETYHKFRDYLFTRFRPIRMHDPTCTSNVHGFRGVRLKPIDYRSVNFGREIEMFINHLCFFGPSAKVLKSRITTEYEKWCERNNRPCMTKNFLSELDDSPHVLGSLIWTIDGNGLGYYGIGMKHDTIAKKTSSTAKNVEKRTTDDVIIDSWSTIAKAAEAEGLPPAKLSRIIKAKQLYNDYYYVVT